ncbi:hypothetical protein HMPREF9057_02996 [Actinomyces sp. oral taxon 171 str. F0337]|nr:hypothetical protein HMPREF9057_02996 [Actinomyces sp. oral taxon 171 str. F0337]
MHDRQGVLMERKEVATMRVIEDNLLGIFSRWPRSTSTPR